MPERHSSITVSYLPLHQNPIIKRFGNTMNVFALLPYLQMYHVIGDHFYMRVFKDVCVMSVLNEVDRSLTIIIKVFHILSKLYDVSVGFVNPPFLGYLLLYLRSPKGGCYSISDDLSFSCRNIHITKTNNVHPES